MKLAIDARCLTTSPTGVGHFLLAAINVWSEKRPDVDFLLLAHKSLHEYAASFLIKSKNVEFIECPLSLLSDNGLLWMLVRFPRVAKNCGATHIWGPAGQLPMFGLKKFVTLVTVHDLFYYTLPGTLSARTRIASFLMAGRTIKKAKHIWSVSNYTADEIKRHYPNRFCKDIIIGSGLNPLRVGRSLDQELQVILADRYRVTDRTLLFVGTLEPRKNLAFLLNLMPALSTFGWRLLVVGCSGWGKSKVASIISAEHYPKNSVFFCDYVPDDDLLFLFRSVDFFISTALMEGFGLPHLEAMAAGCPVIAPSNSAVVEVVGDAGCLVEGWCPDAWVTAIEDSYRNRDYYLSKLEEQVKKHSMQRVCLNLDSALSFNS